MWLLSRVGRIVTSIFRLLGGDHLGSVIAFRMKGMLIRQMAHPGGQRADAPVLLVGLDTHIVQRYLKRITRRVFILSDRVQYTYVRLRISSQRHSEH